MAKSKKKPTSAASALYSAFLSVLVSPRKKHTKVDKDQSRRAWSHPHQGKREMARRRRQLEAGIIRNYPGV